MNPVIKAMIVEDEQKNIDILKNILEKYCEEVELVGSATSVEEAASLLEKIEPDVLFLDIEMPPHKGFELLEKFDRPKFDVVFITAYEEYALTAIKFSALDYLLKPIKVGEVKHALEKVRERKEKNIRSTAPTSYLKDYLKSSGSNLSKIVIPVNDGYNIVDLNDIVYCEALDSYTRVILTNGTRHVVSKSLKEYEEMLEDKGFYRVHKSYLINVNHITKIIKGEGAAVIMSDKQNIPISNRKKNEFFDYLRTIMNI
ncbi:LytR/AlgR family response regulator transcription factor [Thermoflavifilum thermophilum]|uniref:Two component transcriptional regulator, LytTR family n=1 Tax=Thermoflavifilum thermophilum TaxID=1393122 RepID=A0A1I7NEW6_9BACT|nr:LytTR family DNA-binding domain-containing protein [Thermoflavifilum thermophilum]SFV33205.1 two component transcriptional regulator, LytTR family [Thermoflavifilum thermophilum]